MHGGLFNILPNRYRNILIMSVTLNKTMKYTDDLFIQTFLNSRFRNTWKIHYCRHLQKHLVVKYGLNVD